MKVVAVLQARVSSTRLPGKVLLRVCGKAMLAHQIARILRSKLIDQLVVATSEDPSDDALVALCADLNVPVYRGSLNDVLDRMVQAAKPFDPEWMVRLTGDCPLADPALIDQVIAKALGGEYDYVSNNRNPTYPDGLDAECIRYASMQAAWREATLPSQREHVTPFIYQHPERFRISDVQHHTDLNAMRWTVDEPRDFVFVTQVYEHLYAGNPAFGMDDVLALLARQPQLASLNQDITRNEGYAKSLAQDPKTNP